MSGRKPSVPILAVMLIATIFLYSNAEVKKTVEPLEQPTADLPKEIIRKHGAPVVLIPAGEFQMDRKLNLITPERRM